MSFRPARSSFGRWHRESQSGRCPGKGCRAGCEEGKGSTNEVFCNCESLRQKGRPAAACAATAARAATKSFRDYIMAREGHQAVRAVCAAAFASSELSIQDRRGDQFESSSVVLVDLQDNGSYNIAHATPGVSTSCLLAWIRGESHASSKHTNYMRSSPRRPRKDVERISTSRPRPQSRVV